MSKEIYISSTPHETRLAIVESDELTEIYYERENEYTLAGSIYNGKVTRVLPGMQSSFVDIGLERDAFLYITDFMEEAGDSAEFDHGGDLPRVPRVDAPRVDAPRLEGERVEGQRGDGQRTDSQRGGRDGRDRNAEGRNGGRTNDRAGGYVSERNQEQAAATPVDDLAKASEGRGEEFGNRNDRGGRGRGRGRRDRGGNQDRSGTQRVAGEGAATDGRVGLQVPPAFGTEDNGSEEFAQQGVTEAPEAEFNATGSQVAGQTSAATGELGEGAPGADGSRRWRGRRGRRRGRGTGAREGVAGVPGEIAQGSPEVAAAGGSGWEDYAGNGEEHATLEIDGSAAVEQAPAVPEPRTDRAAAVARPVASDGGRRRDGNDRAGRGDRDGQGQRGGRGERNDRSDREQRSPRVPRGFVPTRRLYGVDAEAEQAPSGGDAPVGSATDSDPLILPGESLSKYRKGEGLAAGSSGSVSQPAAVPDSGFKVDPSWDGSAQLPGETLSRYRGGVSESSGGSGRADFRQRDSSGERPGEGRGPRGGRDGVRDAARAMAERTPDTAGSFFSKSAALEPMTVPASEPGVDLQSAGPVAGFRYADAGTEEIHRRREDFQHTELPAATAEAYQDAATGEAHHPGHEAWEAIPQIDAAQLASSRTEGVSSASETEPNFQYEPENASASYRVDPAAPSEYRQSAPAAVEDSPVEEAGTGVSLDAKERGTGEQQMPVEQHVGQQHTAGFTTLADLVVLVEPHAEAPHGGDSAAAHQPEQHTEDHTFEGSEASAAGHETTTIGATGEMISHSDAMHVAPTDQQTAPAGKEEVFAEDDDLAPAQGFAPGAGDLEEDFIDEEEFDAGSLHAHGDAAYDELEEEQVEGAADLGTMLGELNVDQITRSSGALEEDDEEDFEEDTLEEDEAEARADELEDEEAARSEVESFSGENLSTRNEGEDYGSKVGLSADIAPENRLLDGSSVRSQPGTGDGDRRPLRDGGRRNDRRGGRDRNDRGTPTSDRGGSTDGGGYSDRGGYPDRSGLGERARNTGGGGDRDRGRSSGRGGRQTMQSTNLPAISELLKPGQEILCQIAKEPIAKKGARITSHIALPGRFLVFMPTVSHTGVSRKIESDTERRRLKEILLSEKGEAAGGFIVRTAAAGASEEELRSDLRFLLNLWTDIKQRSESSKSPALIYHDLNLVERILRDQVTDNFSAIWVDTETEYERVLRFLQRFQPGLIRRVKLYTKETPLFEQFGITEEINKALRSKVWLKSGGSIVINQTEALVAIDINTGKFVGKTARLEDTIVKTNLDAIPEIVRQIRLRDLGGIIIIDFIDMDDRRNRNRVMAALEDELKSDRAPSKVLPFNDFGLVAITRKRVKQSLERTLSTTCNVCTGTGMVKSPVTVCNDIYVEMRKMHKHLDRGDVMLRVHPEVVKQLKLTGSRWLQEMEEMCGKTILIKSDPSLHPEQFDIH